MVSLAWGKNFFLNHLLYIISRCSTNSRGHDGVRHGATLFAALAALGLQKLCDPDITVEEKTRLWMYWGNRPAVFIGNDHA
jgi:hypothetical protein